MDVSLYFLILLLMQIMDYIFSPEEIIFIIQNLLIQVSGSNYEMVLLDYFFHKCSNIINLKPKNFKLLVLLYSFRELRSKYEYSSR